MHNLDCRHLAEERPRRRGADRRILGWTRRL